MNNALSKRIYKAAYLPPGPIAAALIFFSVSFYLHLPYLASLPKLQYLFVVLPPTGALGCYLLSTKYLRTFSASILAGAIYAFCPFVLAFSAYHRFAGILAAVIPWLFIPAVFIPELKYLSVISGVIKIIVSIFAAAVIILFFYLPSLPSFGPFFPMPMIKPHLPNLAGMILPLTGNAHDFVFSFYHIPLSALIFGVLVYVFNGGTTLIIIAVSALCLSFAEPIVQTPPVAWGLLAVLPFAIITGLGAENLIRMKSKFLSSTLISFFLLTGISVFVFTTGRIFSGTLFISAALFLLATVPMSVKPANFRFALWIVFYTACSADILWGAKCVLEQIFGYAF